MSFNQVKKYYLGANMPKEKAKILKKSKASVKKSAAESKTTSSEVRFTTSKPSAFGITNLIAIIVVLTIFGGIGYFSSKNNTSNENKKQSVAAVQAVAYDGQDGKNALELLKDKAQIQTQDSSIGVFVVSINGVSDTEDQFWMLYVNGELAQSTPDQLVTKNNDKIEWRFEQFK